MTYKVRLWIEDGVINCCSEVCTEIPCPRVGICKETEIEDINKYVATYPDPPELNYCPRCGSDSVHQSNEQRAMKCEKCGLECYVMEVDKE